MSSGPGLSPTLSLSPTLTSFAGRCDSSVLKDMRKEAARLKRRAMQAAKKNLGLKRAPKHRLPGGGRKSKWADVEQELL